MRTAASRAAFLALLMLLASAVGVSAADDDDEWLGIPSGALAIKSTPGLSIAKLDLRLSPEQVVASYSLVNAAEVSRFLELGFPIPSVERPPDDGEGLAKAFSDAVLTKEGVLQELHEVRIRVFMQGVDVTDILASAGLDLRPLAGGNPAEQPRERRRAMEQVLIDAGIEVDPTGWSLAVEPVWRVEVGARSMTNVTLTYTPFPGRSIDRLPADEELEDLAHLAAYCAEKQDGLLEWVLARKAERSAIKIEKLLAEGLEPEDAQLDAYADIELIDLSFRWKSGAWPTHYAKLNLTIDPGERRAAFCVPAPRTEDETEPKSGILAADGLYHVELEDMPAIGQLDIIFLR